VPDEPRVASGHAEIAEKARALNAQLVHVWRVEDGKAVAFQQYTDTLQAARVTERRG